MQHRLVLKFVLALNLCGTWSATAQDYFPLQVGNQWVYKTGGSRTSAPLVLEILRTAEFGGISYVNLHSSATGDYWLRRHDDGSVWQYDQTAKQEKLWYAFQSPVGERYAESLPSCCGQAMVASRAAKYSGRIGDFSNALEIAYPAVFQIGVNRELFLPYIGMVYRSESTGGPSVATYDLSYARVGGVTVVSEKSVSFNVAADQPVKGSDGSVSFVTRLSLRNTSGQPVTLQFPSGQSYDVVVRNGNGDQVYRWSAEKGFTEAIRTETLDSGERNFAVPVRINGPLAPGRYSVEAWLTTAPKVYSGTTMVDVK
jgi:hypothetical protein